LFKENSEFRNFYSAGRVPAIDVQVFFSRRKFKWMETLFLCISPLFMLFGVWVWGVRTSVLLFLTVTFHSLMDDTVEERAAMVAEGRAAVRVRLEFMCRPGILRTGIKTAKHVK
jgi:fatty acid desaturase